MKQITLWASCLLLLMTVGCASSNKKLNPEDYPMHVYDQPFDLVFKRAMEVLGSQPGWILNPTNKAAGVIELTGTTYATWMDVDNQRARFIVRHVNRTQTSFEFDAAGSVCKDNSCHKLLDNVNQVLSALPPHIEVTKQQS